MHSKLLPYIIASFLAPYFLFSQNYWICGNDDALPVVPKALNCNGTSEAYNSIYKHKENYIPRANSKEDFIKTLHVSFHIWQRTDGTGNLDDNQFNRNRLIQIINWANAHYASIIPNPTALPYATEYLNDTKIRIVLDSIYFYQDNTIDSNLYYCNSNGNHNNKLTNYIKSVYPERLNALPLHLVKGYHNNGAAGWSNGSHSPQTNGSVLSFYRTDPDMNTDTEHDYWYAEHLVHEIGHGFDLAHTYQAGLQNCNLNRSDFLWDVYDTTAVSPCPIMLSCDVCILPSDTTNFNIMGGINPNLFRLFKWG